MRWGHILEAIIFQKASAIGHCIGSSKQFFSRWRYGFLSLFCRGGSWNSQNWNDGMEAPHKWLVAQYESKPTSPQPQPTMAIIRQGMMSVLEPWEIPDAFRKIELGTVLGTMPWITDKHSRVARRQKRTWLKPWVRKIAELWGSITSRSWEMGYHRPSNPSVWPHNGWEKSCVFPTKILMEEYTPLMTQVSSEQNSYWITKIISCFLSSNANWVVTAHQQHVHSGTKPERKAHFSGFLQNNKACIKKCFFFTM